MRGDRALNLALAAAFLAVCAAAVVLVGVVALDVRPGDLFAPAPLPSLATSPSPDPGGLAMNGNGVVITDQSSCAGCHTASAGVMLKPIPVLGHPLAGWRNCSACHAPGRLVSVAPGHGSLTQDQCLSCHRERGDASTALTPRPHHVFPGQACSSCHGADKQAPVPDAMSGRTACWLCHHEQTPGAGEAPIATPVTSPAPGGEPLPLPPPGGPVVRPVPSELPLPGDLILG
jgi:hypothetical protein